MASGLLKHFIHLVTVMLQEHQGALPPHPLPQSRDKSTAILKAGGEMKALTLVTTLLPSIINFT